MTDSAQPWHHRHDFHRQNESAERGTRAVMWITLVTMVMEITAGWQLGSMALLADGWHMSSHAAAIGVSALAYAASRRLKEDRRFAFGTWKIEVLGGFASALFLLGVAALMAIASVQRLLDPEPIQFREAIVVAFIGLLVNVLCATILGRVHRHDHGHAQGGHDHVHRHDDLNLRSAYLHVLTDALTSVLAIVALIGGWIWGWVWLDPVMGLAGAALIAIWARRLIVDTSQVLLDREMDHPVVGEIREVIEQLPAWGQVQLTDLHVWRVARDAYACALTVVSSDPTLTASRVRAALSIHGELVHCTIEVHQCERIG